MSAFTAARSLLAALDADPPPPPYDVTVGPALVADLRKLLAAWDEANDGVDDRYGSSRRPGPWVVERRDGADLHLRGPGGEEWTVSDCFLAEELAAGRMWRVV